VQQLNKAQKPLTHLIFMTNKVFLIEVANGTY
jgi:hypothetical protein